MCGTKKLFCTGKYQPLSRYTLVTIGLLLLCSSCGIFRQSTGSHTATSDTGETTPAVPLHQASASANYRERVVGIPLTNPGYNYINVKGLDIEQLDNINFRYAMQLDVPVELITNPALYHFIDDWMGTPYHLGGNGKDGVDCSGFTKILEQAIFRLDLPRTSVEQFRICHKVPVPEMQEGDLVFFATTRKGVSHVGIYLINNKFVHASTSFGVMISDLGDPYWSKRFRGAGRMPQ